MNRVFQINRMFPISDGSAVCPLLNLFDSNERSVSPQTLSGMSVAAGEIALDVGESIWKNFTY